MNDWLTRAITMKQVFEKMTTHKKKSTQTTFFLQLKYVARSFLLVTASEIAARQI